MKPKPPCLECVVRHPYCHGSCDLFAEYRQALDHYNEIHQTERERERRLDDYEIERTRKARRK